LIPQGILLNLKLIRVRVEEKKRKEMQSEKATLYVTFILKENGRRKPIF